MKQLTKHQKKILRLMHETRAMIREVSISYRYSLPDTNIGAIRWDTFCALMAAGAVKFAQRSETASLVKFYGLTDEAIQFLNKEHRHVSSK